MLLQSLLRPVLTPLMRGMFDAPIASSAAWSPLALWPDGIDTPGMWISPRDLTSEWQDSAGTTPVATPGTVADSSNPVGLARDIRAGAPEVLGSELLVNGDFSDGGANWQVQSTWTFSGGFAVATATSGLLYQNFTTPPFPALNEIFSITYTISDYVSGAIIPGMTYGNGKERSGNGTYTDLLFCENPAYVSLLAVNFTGKIDNVSLKKVLGNHMLQSTSAARPLMSAYDGQTLGPGDTYSSTGYPIFQKYDGADDGMATAAFTAGTLINGMDCMIPVRRDSAATMVFCSDASDEYFGYCAAGSGIVHTFAAGSPTVWVDGVQLAGGTSVTAGAIDAALTVGDWHILEFRGLDLSTWASFCFSKYYGFYFPGARGDIMLYPSTASTEDKDAARQYLADYYGVTLP